VKKIFNVLIYATLQYPFRSLSVTTKWWCHFVLTFWLSGRLGLGVGVKTSLVTDSENDKIEGENFHVKKRV